MNKLTKYAAAGAMALTILPFAASAHGNDNGNTGSNKSEIKSLLNFNSDRGDRGDNSDNEDNQDRSERKAFAGTVSAVSATGFTLTDAKGTVYTVTTAGATIQKPFSGTLVLADIKANDKVVVKGTLTGTTIAAKSIIDMPANTHPAATRGTVTAVNGNVITVQNTHTGVVSNVTVNADANTQVTKDGKAATLADATVGTKISVKGLWNETLNILNAIKISIRTALNK
jgi:hypothetical protein